MLAAGKLRHRVILQRKIKTQTETGKVIHKWETYAQSVAALVMPSSVREFVTANTELGEVAGRILIRYRRNINHNDRVLFRNMVYDIVGILADNKSGLEYQTLVVKTGVSNG